MSIVVGHLIKAADIRDRLKGNLDSIKDNLTLFGEEGQKIGFFEGPQFDNDVINQLEPSNYDDFLNAYNLLSSSFFTMSSMFDVEPGKLICLSGFYLYALSCHAAASYVRHTVYVLYQQNVTDLKIFSNASYLKEVPTMSALIPAEAWSADKSYSTDFRTNWANNNQQSNSDIDEYVSGTDNCGNRWDSKEYFENGGLADHAELSALNDQEKKLHIGGLCQAASTAGMLDILREINVDLGESISCLYFWINGRSEPLPSVSVIYDVDRYSNLIVNSNGGRITSTKVFPTMKFFSHTVRSLAQLGWRTVNPEATMDSWIVRNSGTSWRIGSSHVIEQTLTLIPNLNGLVKKFDIWNYWESRGGAGTSTLTGYRFSGSNVHESNGIVEVSGLQGFSYAEIEKLECGANEFEETHQFEVYMIDLNDANETSRKKLLVRYTPAWQTESYVPRYAKVVYSCFPRTGYSGRIRLKINSQGKLRFKIEAEYGFAGDVGGRQFFLEATEDVAKEGGIHNIKVYV